MTGIHYYLTVFPTEALIASMLEPDDFGAYMATSSKRGSQERLMFIEIKGGFGKDFDWKFAQERCIPHKNGIPKHSVYLSVYRVLEKVPTEMMLDLFLTTSDGRTIGLAKTDFPKDSGQRPYYLYQELCPIQPLVVSSLAPAAFSDYIMSDQVKISLPALMFCDLKVIDLSDPVNTGNIGPMYDRNLGHLNECIKAVREREKRTKTLDRTFAGSFTFQIVKTGFGVISRHGRIWYPLPGMEELNSRYYDWSRSAMIL